ncbi:hypothetical protein KP509_23G031600 [Ceratopteris richardii]|uniref:Bromo domain-containing protein n=1 Tax=Ceratopteris richardii TaxID=49495 RepID=A0A8T2RYN9_CERRI|nr:hypothetical protein KP509_23G031600 [Ceratopteris richardii]
MTKVKVKGSFLSKPVDRGRHAADDYLIDEDDYERVDLASKPSFLPFVNPTNKGKRGPRVALRPSLRDSSGLQSSDSALGTSSSKASDDENDIEESVRNHPEKHRVIVDNTTNDSVRRGSVRVKVMPSKFRESQLPGYPVSEGRSPLKKKHAGPSFESIGSKQTNVSRDYSSADPHKEHVENELSRALTVVKKIMRMEAAEPFNVPVDPVALGIPDYFDIVKKPMDLGTICKNLERGGKYRSSRDVYEDVQLVWTNCRIYNQKGDPILDLLARVKKNFMKYWTAAKLYTEKSPGNFKSQASSETEFGGASFKQTEIHDDIDYGRSKKINKFGKESQSPAPPIAKPAYEQEEQKPGMRGLMPMKHSSLSDKPSKQKEVDSQTTPGKSRRVSGTGHHKADCSCVVCTGVRRKLAREGKLPSHLVNPAATTELPPTQERILVRLKTEGSGDKLKVPDGSGSGQKTKDKRDSQKRNEIDGEQSEPSLLKRVKVDDSEMISMDTDLQRGIEGDEALISEEKKVSVKEEGKGYSESEGKLESGKTGYDEDFKGGEEVDERDDGVQNDEQLTDLLDTETERQEGGVKYYKASYEMPLRKINPSILQVSSKLFGSGSSWGYGRSLRRHLSRSFPENPIHSCISQLLNPKVT